MAFVVLTGASGSGKTAIAQEIRRCHPDEVQVFHFDQIGVPAPDVMIAAYGSGENWQRAKTLEWVTTLSPLMAPDRNLLFEGQTRLSFLADAIRACGSPPYWPILVDCDDTTRAARLALGRQQPELATSDMMAWAAYLREEAAEAGCERLDTSAQTLEDCVSLVMKRLRTRQPADPT